MVAKSAFNIADICIHIGKVQCKRHQKFAIIRQKHTQQNPVTSYQI